MLPFRQFVILLLETRNVCLKVKTDFGITGALCRLSVLRIKVSGAHTLHNLSRQKSMSLKIYCFQDTVVQSVSKVLSTF